MPTKELRDFALKIKEETGNFPVLHNWIKSKGYPISRNNLSKLFGPYNNFRKYCNVSKNYITKERSLEWIKVNCIIDSNSCWNWNKSLRSDGYGQTNKNRKNG